MSFNIEWRVQIVSPYSLTSIKTWLEEIVETVQWGYLMWRFDMTSTWKSKVASDFETYFSFSFVISLLPNYGCLPLYVRLVSLGGLDYPCQWDILIQLFYFLDNINLDMAFLLKWFFICFTNPYSRYLKYILNEWENVIKLKHFLVLTSPTIY